MKPPYTEAEEFLYTFATEVLGKVSVQIHAEWVKQLDPLLRKYGVKLVELAPKLTANLRWGNPEGYERGKKQLAQARAMRKKKVVKSKK